MTKILIVNQHGSNRGDEAACRGMIYGLRRYMPDANINILTVYPLSIEGLPGVSFLPNLDLRGREGWPFYRQMLRYLTSYYTGIKTTQEMETILGWYRSADLVISAPGGPYIGDLYPWTEQELAFHILLGKLARKPVMIYAPSMGPFQNQVKNRWRKQLLARVDIITVREHISARHLSSLGIRLPDSFITADSALQHPVDRDLGERVFHREGLDTQNRYFGFIPLEPERFSDGEKRYAYIELLVDTLRMTSQELDAHIVMFPQGYGVWRDKPFLDFLAHMANLGNRIKVLSEDVNSNEQQALIGKMDLLISFRYHPTIFAVRQNVPCIAIAYEHKMRGFMQAVGLEENCLDLETVTLSQIMSKTESLCRRRGESKTEIQSKITKLERESLKNSYIAYLLIKHWRSSSGLNLSDFIETQLRRTWDEEQVA